MPNFDRAMEQNSFAPRCREVKASSYAFGRPIVTLESGLITLS